MNEIPQGKQQGPALHVQYDSSLALYLNTKYYDGGNLQFLYIETMSPRINSTTELNSH
jgi:hypothetical protein